MSPSDKKTVQRRPTQSYTLEEAADQIADHPAPVLFPDTCSLVDLVRLPNPNRTNRSKVADCERELAAADTLLGHLKEQNLWVVVPPPIWKEYHDHAPKAAERVCKEWEKIDDQVHVSLFAASVIEVPENLPSQTNFGQALKPLLAAIKRISDNLIHSGLLLELNDDCYTRATYRAWNKTPPGHQGGELEDCVIVEHILALSGLLDDQGVTTRRVLLTSNTTDFSVRKGAPEPKPPLDSQFDDAGVQLTIKWQQAQAKLRI